MSNFLLPKIGCNLSSTRISRLFFGFWRSCFLMCAQIFFVTSLRGSGSVPTILANVYGHGQSHMRKRLREAAHQSIRFRVVFLRQESCVAPQPHDLQRQRPRPLCPVRTRSTIEWNWVDSQLLRQMDCSLHYNLCSL